MQYRDHGSDSSYDIVPVPRGAAETLRRRAPPPPTTIQIDDDFDAITEDEGFRTVYGEWAEMQEVQRHQQGRGYSDGLSEYGRYAREVEHVLGVDVDLEVSKEGKSASSTREIVMQHDHDHSGEHARNDVFVSSRTNNYADPNAPHAARNRGSSGSKDGMETLQRRGSGRGEKITVWREQVARNEDNDHAKHQGNRSVGTYDGIVRESAWKEYQPGVTGRSGDNQIKSANTRRIGGVEVSDVFDAVIFGTEDPEQDSVSPLRRCLSNASQISHRSERIYTSDELTGHFKIPRGANRKAKPPSPTRSERMYSMAELKALSSMQAKMEPSEHLDRMEPGVGHGKEGFTFETQASRNNLAPRKPMSYSEPRKSSPPRYGPANDTAQAFSTSSTVEAILSSCQPTLLHIAPALASVGIKQVEHLRAFARLREETRDREVKEEVLKMGVSVLEWAILMDRLQTLS